MKWLLTLILLSGCSMLFDGKQVGGAEHGPARMRFNGATELCQTHIYEGRVLLGTLKHQMQQGGIKNGQVDQKLPDGTKLHAQSNMWGLADIDEIWIDVSSSTTSKTDELEVYGYIVQNAQEFTIITPSGKEVGDNAKDTNGNPIDFSQWNPYLYDGYPDNGVKLATLTNSPEFQYAFVSDYSEGSSWEIYDTCANIPVPESFEYRYYDDNIYNAQVSLITKRTDSNGFWWSGTYKVENGLFILDEAIDEPFLTTIVMIPMSASSKKFKYADYIPVAASYDNPVADSYVIDLVKGNNYPFSDPHSDHEPIPGCTFEYKIWVRHDYTSASMSAANFGIQNKVEKGTHYIRDDMNAPYQISFRILLYTNKGIIEKYVVTDYGLQTGKNVFSIEVGVVDSFDAVIKKINNE